VNFPVRILVIESEEPVRDSLVKLLRKEGHTVCWAARWDMGIVQMRREKPDLVLLDMLLPETGGWQIAYQRIKDPELRKISMIVLSGTTDADIRSQGLASVFSNDSCILNMPYDTKKLLLAIAHIQGLPKASTDE
jgi:CheY-like chemotaxis protein